MERIRRSGERLLRRVVLTDELVLLFVIYLWASSSLAVLAAILTLHASFWVICEILYVENDRGWIPSPSAAASASSEP